MFQNTMNENDKKNLFTRFNDCRQKFVLSLNSITVLSLFVLLTTFIPYTTYLGNLVDVRVDQKEALTEKEINGNFDLIELEEKWLQQHEPTVVIRGTDVDGNSQFKTSLGAFNISNAGLALIYPAVLSGLIIYLLCSMYNLYDLRRELKDNYENKKILQVPTARMALCWILLYLSFFWSVHTLISVKSVQYKEKLGQPVLTLLSRRFSQDQKNISPDQENEGIVSLGQVVVQQLNFQVDDDLDTTIVLLSTLAVVLAPLTYSVFYWKLFSSVSSHSLKTLKTVNES